MNALEHDGVASTWVLVPPRVGSGEPASPEDVREHPEIVKTLSATAIEKVLVVMLTGYMDDR